MEFQTRLNAYRCKLPGCRVAYSIERGYFLVDQKGQCVSSRPARDILYAAAALCLCDNDDGHSLYIEHYAAARRVRFWRCPVRDCGYEVSQRLEKTHLGWRTCGSFEQPKAVRVRHW
jgi:hypothetical protein